jgi:hypothetical protein
MTSITPESLSFLIQILTLGGIVFAVVKSIKQPQEKSKLNDVLFEERLGTMKDLFINLRDNHIHTLEVKLDKHISDQQLASQENTKRFTRLETLLDERLPRK